jgi:hypothetical protein
MKAVSARITTRKSILCRIIKPVMFDHIVLRAAKIGNKAQRLPRRFILVQIDKGLASGKVEEVVML